MMLCDLEWMRSGSSARISSVDFLESDKSCRVLDRRKAARITPCYIDLNFGVPRAMHEGRRGANNLRH